jgi:tyrosine phenol-lyase
LIWIKAADCASSTGTSTSFPRTRAAARIPYLSLHATVNMAGGQPISMANARAVAILCRRHGIRVFMDATRAVENCYFINMVVIYEGLHTYGGLAGRDMEAMAIGIRESPSYNHMHARIGQVH